eukprot:SAG25_NODE_10053_length_347_cov_1.016129_1_plen_45_part_10
MGRCGVDNITIYQACEQAIELGHHALRVPTAPEMHWALGMISSRA